MFGFNPNPNIKTLVELPSDFAPTLPFNLYENAQGKVLHDWDLTQFKTGADTIAHVNRSTGNDSTGDGTLGNPYQTVGKAWTSITAGTWTKAVIYAVGSFKRTEISGITIPAGKTLCLIGDESTVFYSDKAHHQSWSADGNAYKASRTSCMNVVDLTSTADDNGLVPALIQVASADLCKSTAGSWYTDGTYLWVHTSDARQPDLNIELVIGGGGLAFTLDDGSTLYLENFICRRPIQIGGTSGLGRVIRNNVTISLAGGTAANGFEITDTNDVYTFDSISAYCQKDGNNYHFASTASPLSKLVFEYNCVSYGNGTDTGDQASTCHEGISALRVNGKYNGKTGPAVADVTGCNSVLINCDCVSAVDAIWCTDDTNPGQGRTTLINTHAHAPSPYYALKVVYARLNKFYGYPILATTIELI